MKIETYEEPIAQPKVDIDSLPKIVAIDFDGTLVTNKYPEIGDKIHRVFTDVKFYKTLGWKVILWTCRDNDCNGNKLDEAVAYCKEQGLEFDAVNKNIPEVIAMFGNDTRKVYADLYIDDKAVAP